MEIDEESYNKLLLFARRKYLKYRLSWLEPKDIVHDFLVSPKYDSTKDERLIFLDFRDFIIDSIRRRTGKKRQALSQVKTFSDFRRPPHQVVDEDAEEERLDVFFYRHSAVLREGNEPGRYLGDGGYRDPFTDEINYNLMLRDMLIVMLRYDKYFKWHIYNTISWEAEPRVFLDLVDWYHNLELDNKRLIFGLMLAKMVGETQKELADRIGVSQSYISRLQKRLFYPLKIIAKKTLKTA